MAITTVEGLKSFLDDVSKQPHWNFKDDFLSALRDNPINFDKELLLLIRSTAGSGSITISLDGPTVNEDDLLFRLILNSPGMQTADMNYQCFAVVLPKSARKNARVIRNLFRDYEPRGLSESKLQEVIPLQPKPADTSP